MNLHQTSPGPSKHLNTTFHIEKSKKSLVDYGVIKQNSRIFIDIFLGKHGMLTQRQCSIVTLQCIGMKELVPLKLCPRVSLSM